MSYLPSLCLFVGEFMSYLRYLCLFVGEFMSYLRYLCLFVGVLMSYLRGLKCTHSNYGASKESRIVIFRHYLPVPGVGNLRACCLPWMW